MSDWFKFDGPDDKDDQHVDEIDTHERTALDAVNAIARMADTHPEQSLIIGAALRKISTVAGSKAQSLHLRSMTVQRKVRL